LVSVIIPARDTEDVLPHQLEALSRQTYMGAWEVIVADNGSRDRTKEVARTWAARLPALSVCDASFRPGANLARNVAARAAQGDFLAFCDADDVAADGWLEGLVAAAAGFDLVGGWCEDMTLNDPMTRGWRLAHPRNGLPVVLGFLPYAISANLGVWASVHNAIGGWNDGYAGGDEVDFCWRAQLAGFTLGFAPRAVMHYRHRTGLRALARQLTIYGMAEPRLYRDFRGRGVPPKRLRGSFRNWLWVAAHLPYLFASAERRGIWVRRAAFSWGRLRGSVRYRVVCL
jgi:glycosyltransferase involved in cell wall biosynthesis